MLNGVKETEKASVPPGFVKKSPSGAGKVASFKTDVEISDKTGQDKKKSSKKSKQKNFEVWQPELGDEDSSKYMFDENDAGWSAHDMFKNHEEHAKATGIQSNTFSQ